MHSTALLTEQPPGAALMDALAYAYGEPACGGIYRVKAEDFVVEEQIAFSLSGEGEHLWCWVEKRGENTDWVAQQLAKWAGVSPANVGVAGQKDRHALTRQWFSLWLPGQSDPQSETLHLQNVHILKMQRHGRKLQTGGLSGNYFELVVRDLQGQCDGLQARLEQIAQAGVPNYFGDQRFGFNGANLGKASALFEGRLPRVKRNQKSLYISAARSWLFNRVLSERIRRGDWNSFVRGDALQLEGSTRWFEDDGSPELAARVAAGDLHPTGPLYGRGTWPVQDSVADLEQAVVAEFPAWLAGLEKLGLKQERRALRVLPRDLSWQWLDEDGTRALRLSFGLPAGSYATMVLRELLRLEDAQLVAKRTATDAAVAASPVPGVDGDAAAALQKDETMRR